MAIQDFDLTTKTVKNPKRKKVFIAVDKTVDVSYLFDIIKEHRLPLMGNVHDISATLELIRKHKVGTLFIDCDMEGVDCPQLMDKLKINYPEVQVIALTGAPTRELVEQLNEKGAQGILLKPLRRDMIRKAVHSIK